LHLDDTHLTDLARQADLLSTVQKLLGADVYIYQFKVNIKAAFTGAPWPWHDDYSFWHLEDGMPGPYALTVAVFLDEVTDLNGPMMLVPGSHLEHEFGTLRADATGAWQENVSVDLRYQSSRSRVTDLARRYGVKSCVGTPGSLLFFDCRVLHASAGNISPFARRIAFITYNRVDNVPGRFDRPEFLVARTHAALCPGVLPIMDSSSD
jgi:ectoine hydroxylase